VHWWKVEVEFYDSTVIDIRHVILNLYMDYDAQGWWVWPHCVILWTPMLLSGVTSRTKSWPSVFQCTTEMIWLVRVGDTLSYRTTVWLQITMLAHT
jgi:hypothetical protein